MPLFVLKSRQRRKIPEPRDIRDYHIYLHFKQPLDRVDLSASRSRIGGMGLDSDGLDVAISVRHWRGFWLVMRDDKVSTVQQGKSGGLPEEAGHADSRASG
ncbi:hypothetical protein SDC9_103167 [bioreactor metagenome]|uniref:Uncharacterized protein n=1 Tax=bioreactor metagenome TaxID=1076179 RepID=A0A645ASW6_9ZZZZ